jgi:hypothetical protein
MYISSCIAPPTVPKQSLGRKYENKQNNIIHISFITDDITRFDIKAVHDISLKKKLIATS